VNETHPPLFPHNPQNPPASIPGAIREYLKARQIWKVRDSCFQLNDEFSMQVRRDTLRFGIEEKHRIGK